MKYRLSAACSCSVGCIRVNNEDNFFFDGCILPQENHGTDQVMIMESNHIELPISFGVFDGMGGEEDGQVASYLAAQSFKNDCVRLQGRVKTPVEFLETTIANMNGSVWNVAQKNFGCMGTTVAMVHFSENQVYTCNVGDSKVFRFHCNEMSQMSKDHTDAYFLEMQGIKTRKPRLTQYIGISPDEMLIEPHILGNELCSGDRYLVCSDGLTDMLTKSEIQHLTQKVENLAECVKCLVDTALERGGKDNITVILVKIE